MHLKQKSTISKMISVQHTHYYYFFTLSGERDWPIIPLYLHPSVLEENLWK